MSVARSVISTASLVLALALLSLPGSARGDARPAAPGLSRHEQVSALIPRLGPALRQRVAQAVVAEAERAGLDPLLVLALIHTESSFDPAAVSSAGAVGLMQLKARTMRGEAERSRLASADPRDPVASVQAGVRYLRRLVDTFGALDLALMAYNAGPSRVQAHLRQGGIPEHLHAYPEKVNGELARLRRVAARAAPASAAG